MAVVKVPVALGGTGADNAADARANLGISSNTAGGAYSGIFVSNAQIKSSNVSGNVTINTGNVMLSKAGANVTFEVPGTTVVGAQFKTPGIHDLATQRIVTIKSNNYSANRLLDYQVPTINIKAKYSNVAINTAGRILFSNRFDDEASMPSPSKYEGFIAFDRNPGSVGDLYVSNALQRHKILIANTDLTPGTNNFYSIGTEALRWQNLRVSNDITTASGNVFARGITIGDAIIYYSEADTAGKGVRIGFNTSTPEYVGINANCNVYISGNLVVAGNVYIKNTQHLIIDDPVIELGANIAQQSSPTLDSGLLMNRGSASNAFLGYDESRDEMAVAYTADPSAVNTITIAGYTPLQTGPLHTNYLANLTGNTSISRSLVVGYTDHRVPQANLDVKGNAYITGAMSINDGEAVASEDLSTALAVALG